MKKSTIEKYIKILADVKESGENLSSFCSSHNINYNNIARVISNIRKRNENRTKEMEELLSLHKEIINRKPNKLVKEKVDTDDRAETSYIRDEKGKIKYYSYQIFRRDKPSLTGRLTREEMNLIHRLYSYYGDSLTQRIISRHFPELSLIDFKRVLRAFNITKASAPFAPHMIEELSEEDLRQIQLREKENSFLRKAEEDQIRNNEKLLKQYAQENIELKKQIKAISSFSLSIPEVINPEKIVQLPKSSKNINLYFSDFHLGAAVTSGVMYEENISYGLEEAKRRLNCILNKLSTIGPFDTVNIVLMGDNIDCAGVFGKTARLDHDMPENMDVREQANSYITLVLWFIESMICEENRLCSSVKVYSVPCGNHGGNFEYMCNKALLAYINALHPDIQTTLWEEFFGIFTQNNETFVCCHGKDDQYMRKGLPLNLDDKSKVMLYEWLHENKIYNDKVHFIKGDLHSNSINSCKRLDYRNVLSLYGASDYSNYNFSRNSYGMSYDLFVGDNLLRGTFEDL